MIQNSKIDKIGLQFTACRTQATGSVVQSLQNDVFATHEICTMCTIVLAM